ncbi:MAG: adenylate/guanylate cyclase domain-containing protein [Candidatus Aenigmarchaeota archaeon]|nr:adenylate/guanylate cyclase domain-containing protein [Candidatus Aenigmarchaeota archaeon]
MPTKDEPIRMDFIQEIVNVDEEKRILRVKLIPDPERYEIKEIDGEKGFYDKFDHVFIPLKAMEESFKKSGPTPLYYSPRRFNDTLEYIKSRIQEIRNHLDGTQDNKYEFSDVSEEFLETLPQEERKFVILSIDLINSTRMSQTLSSTENVKIISLFLKEMAMLIHAFNGYVLKFLGDGIIAYFPEPNFIGQNDNALDCAASMKLLIYNGINPMLKEKGLPELNFRIGLDSGEATIITVGADKIKKHKDLIGETINIAAKIQSVANKNEILVGEATVKNAHTFWRKLLIKKNPVEKWDYKDRRTGTSYELYFLKEPTTT